MRVVGNRIAMQVEQYQYLCNVLEIRERSLRSVREEVDLLNMCGGLSQDDIVRLRASIVGNISTGDPHNAIPAIVIKDEPTKAATHNPNQPTTSLKAMIQGMLPCLLPDSQITQLCKRVKRRITTVYTFQRHKATFLLTNDWPHVRAALEQEMAESGWRYGAVGAGGGDGMGDAISVDE